MFTFPVGLFSATQGAGVAYDADAQAYINRLTGTYTTPELDAINAFFVGLKATESLYSTIIASRIYALANATDAVLNIKGTTFTATNNNMTFTARQGFTGNGSNSSVSSNVIPSSNGMLRNSATYGVYIRSGPENQTDMGGRSAANAPTISLRASTASGTPLSTLHASSIPAGVTSSHITGMQLWSRTAANLTTHYTRGVSNGTISLASSDPPTVQITIGATNTGGSISGSGTRQYALDLFVDIGWNATQATNFSTAVETLLDAFGAGVVP